MEATQSLGKSDYIVIFKNITMCRNILFVPIKSIIVVLVMCIVFAHGKQDEKEFEQYSINPFDLFTELIIMCVQSFIFIFPIVAICG